MDWIHSSIIRIRTLGDQVHAFYYIFSEGWPRLPAPRRMT